jgi:hypothetical protein
MEAKMRTTTLTRFQLPSSVSTFHSKCIVSFFKLLSKTFLIFTLFTAKKQSDKYLEESRKSQHKEKKRKDRRRNRRNLRKSRRKTNLNFILTEPKPLHVVNTTIEMPEGAVMSDNDDKNDLDVNDPHRALDIDLEADEI